MVSGLFRKRNGWCAQTQTQTDTAHCVVELTVPVEEFAHNGAASLFRPVPRDRAEQEEGEELAKIWDFVLGCVVGRFDEVFDFLARGLGEDVRCQRQERAQLRGMA
eukprot:1979271-Rhodomonas_salina.4